MLKPGGRPVNLKKTVVSDDAFNGNTPPALKPSPPVCRPLSFHISAKPSWTRMVKFDFKAVPFEFRTAAPPVHVPAGKQLTLAATAAGIPVEGTVRSPRDGATLV